MKDEAELQFQIDLLESFDADSDEQLNAQMICWLKELQHRRAAMLQGAEPATDNTAQQFEALAGSQASAQQTFTVSLPSKVYIREMRASVLRFTDVVEAITAAGGKVVHADGYTSAGSGKQ